MSGEKRKREDAGSLMHVLDWTGDSKYFVGSVNLLIKETGARVSPGDRWMPQGRRDTREFEITRAHDALRLLPDYPDAPSAVRKWWLGEGRGNVSNWDMACQATFPGERRGIVLVEAKAHVFELTNEVGGKSVGDTPVSKKNHEHIGMAIDQASKALGVNISRDRCSQFSSRVAHAWRLATPNLPPSLTPALKVPCILIYLGFTGDPGIRDGYLRHAAHWKQVLDEHVADVFPNEWFGTRILPGDVPLWVLRRTLPAQRVSLPIGQRLLLDE